MQNRKTAIIGAICFLLVGIFVAYSFFKNEDLSSSSVNSSVIEDTFTIESIKLNKHDSSNSDDLPNIENIRDVFSIEQTDSYRRDNDPNGNAVRIIESSNATYEIKENSDWEDKTVLLKDGTEIWSENLVFTTYDPIRSYFNVEESIVLAYDHFADNSQRQRDVIVNGESMNEKYAAQSSFAAYKLKSDFVFFVEKDSKNHLVIGGSSYELPSVIKEIIDPPCCSGAAYEIIAENNQIVFYSVNQDGYWYQNKITLE
jgi:hypothetical protein